MLGNRRGSECAMVKDFLNALCHQPLELLNCSPFCLLFLNIKWTDSVTEGKKKKKKQKKEKEKKKEKKRECLNFTIKEYRRIKVKIIEWKEEEK